MSDKKRLSSYLLSHHSSLITHHRLMDRLIEETPFFTDEHARLAVSAWNFAAREIEPHAAAEEGTDEELRSLVALLAQADLLRYSVARPGAALEARSLCVLRETLSYFSPLADLAFVMQ